ncbi:methyltransferase domain-containing protein [Microcoleus sp. T3_D1]|uniref:methyltransferase domain-containing protein n=1 Tax=Microcoleus sp. T3_D1 TaxID=3055427 RepID=UPI002FD691A1
MPNDLTAGTIQSRILQYASLKHELRKATPQQHKLTTLNVVLSAAEGTVKIAIKEELEPNSLFPPTVDETFFEVETSALESVLVGIPKIDAINLDAKGAAPLIFHEIQNIIKQNPQITMYIVFNSSDLDRSGSYSKTFIYELLKSGFSLTKMNSRGKVTGISEAELLGSATVKLVCRKIRKSSQRQQLVSAIQPPVNFEFSSHQPNHNQAIDAVDNTDTKERVCQNLTTLEPTAASNKGTIQPAKLTANTDKFKLALTLSGIAPQKETLKTQEVELETKKNVRTQEEQEQYLYQPGVADQSFSESVEDIKKSGYKVVASGIDNSSPEVVAAIVKIADSEGIYFQPYEVEIAGYKEYFNRAEYLTKYSDYYPGNQVEKSLEHYLGLCLLNLNEKDIFVDLASENSPIPEIYHRLTEATTFSQDIMYPPGINGNQIGGDACSMPVPEGFASKAALTCSIEHFEGDADTRLFVELSRVLKPGGILFVCPFYIYTEAATQTDPQVSLASNVNFDEGTTIYCAERWGNRHARFYSPRSFKERIMNPVKEQFKFDFYYLENAAKVDASVYARFAFTATRL